MPILSQRFRIGIMPNVFGAAVGGLVLVGGAVSWTTLSYMDRDIEDNARKQLDLAINLESALIEQHLAQVKTQAAALAESQKVKDDLKRSDFAAIASDLRDFRQAMPNLHILTLVDPAGKVVARANGDQTGQPLSANGLVSVALKGTPVSSAEIIPQAEWGPEGEELRKRVVIPVKATQGSEERKEKEVTDGLSLVGVAPVKDSAGQVIGAVVAAEVLNQNFAIVDEVRNRTNGLVSATIAMDAIRVTTNVKLKDAQGKSTENRAIGTIYSIPVMKNLRAGTEYRGRAIVVGEWQKTVYVPLKDHTGKVIAGPYVGIPEVAFFALRDRFVRARGVGAGIVFAAGAAGGSDSAAGVSHCWPVPVGLARAVAARRRAGRLRTCPTRRAGGCGREGTVVRWPQGNKAGPRITGVVAGVPAGDSQKGVGITSLQVFLRILAVIGGIEVLVMVVLQLSGIPDGIWKSLLDAVLLTALSAPFLYMSVIRTMAQRLAAQAALDLVQGLEAIVWEADASTWRFSFVSRHAEEVLGYPVERWLGKPGFWAGLIHPEDRERATAFCQTATSAGKDHEFEYRAVAADGRVVWLRDIVRVVRDGHGRVRRRRGLMLDITERKRVETALRESEERFQGAFANAPIGMALQGVDGRCLQVNRSLCEMLG